ncbi:MAG: hypothetical protein DCF22_08225 [Leptolyngbya sp.]|nr:MAG: hypothetical protein DCF22_08225 [Leptolyngbya sp.]
MLDRSIDEEINLGAISSQIGIKNQYSSNGCDASCKLTLAEKFQPQIAFGMTQCSKVRAEWLG